MKVKVKVKVMKTLVVCLRKAGTHNALDATHELRGRIKEKVKEYEEADLTVDISCWWAEQLSVLLLGWLWRACGARLFIAAATMNNLTFATRQKARGWWGRGEGMKGS